MKNTYASLYLIWVFLSFLVSPSTALGQFHEQPSYELFGPPGSAIESPQRQALKDLQYDANDYYNYQGEPLRLHRSLLEYTVRFKAGLSETEKEGLIRDVTLLGNLSYTTGKHFSIVRLEPVSMVDPAELRAYMEEALARLRTEENVEFAFPVFQYPESGTKLFLTDEIVLRLDNDRNIEDLASLHKTYGTTVVRKMWGT